MNIGNHQHIVTEVKQQLLYMSHNYSLAEVSHTTVTGVGARTQAVRRIKSLHKLTGSVVRVSVHVGRPQKMNALDLAVHILRKFIEKELRCEHESTRRARKGILDLPNADNCYLFGPKTKQSSSAVLVKKWPIDS